MDDRLEQWRALPRRLYLDTGTLQTLFDYGDLIFDDEPFVATTRDRGVPNLAEEVEALRLIMAVNERAGFEFVVSGASIREVDARGEGNYASWVRDVLDTWLVQSEGEERVEVDVQRPGSVSARDWRLLVDALAHRSDAFLTMERRLFTQAPVVQRNTGLRVCGQRPTETFWLRGRRYIPSVPGPFPVQCGGRAVGLAGGASLSAARRAPRAVAPRSAYGVLPLCRPSQASYGGGSVCVHRWCARAGHTIGGVSELADPVGDDGHYEQGRGVAEEQRGCGGGYELARRGALGEHLEDGPAG